MRLRNTTKRVRAWWPLVKRVGPRCLLACLTGCRGAATPYASDPGSSPSSRRVVLTRQVMSDSAVEVANRPLTTSWHFLHESVEHFSALTTGEFGKRVVLPIYGTPDPLSDSTETLDLNEFDAELQQITGENLQPAHLQLQVSGDDSLAALEQLISQATASIDVIMFQWESDKLGQTIAARLAAVAGPNLHVRILIDGGGNMFFSEPEDADAAAVNRVIHNLAQHPYIEVVRIRNPFARYDHRKIVIVDGRVAWTGGRNFCFCAFFEHHDLTFVLNGPLVCQMQQRFEEYWADQGGQSPAPPVASVARAQAAETMALAAGLGTANCQARLLDSEPGNRQLAAAIYEAIDRARHHVYVENVYLTDSRLVVKLAEARRRGVDVRVIMTVESTSPTINQSNRVVANRLFQAGIRVYLFAGMTHVKAVAVDGVWAYLGTGNLDPLSLRHNHELGFSITGRPFINELEQRLFLPDMGADRQMHEPLHMTFQDWLSEWAASICL